MHTEAGEVLVHSVLPFRGLSWWMERSHGEELRCLGQQPRAMVRPVREAIQNETAAAYLLRDHKRTNESSQHHAGQSWVLPKWLTCRIGSKEMVLVSNHWKLLSSTLPFLVPVSQSRDMSRLHGRRPSFEGTCRAETRSVLSDQDRSNSGWWASRLGPLWPDDDQDTHITTERAANMSAAWH